MLNWIEAVLKLKDSDSLTVALTLDEVRELRKYFTITPRVANFYLITRK